MLEIADEIVVGYIDPGGSLRELVDNFIAVKRYPYSNEKVSFTSFIWQGGKRID